MHAIHQANGNIISVANFRTKRVTQPCLLLNMAAGRTGGEYLDAGDKNLSVHPIGAMERSTDNNAIAHIIRGATTEP